MLNLLFISDSPKVENVKGVLQPLLKVIIDVVTDFDHGLKDVFEKRPATVCIQDQINGVTGESVARHIKMLLGNGAPSFILLHTGNLEARAVKGLYEHLIDLSQPTEALAENIISTLKSLHGDQWEKIYISPFSTPVIKDTTTTSAPISASPVTPAAEFRISHKTPPVEEHIPEDILPAFEENYRSESLFMGRSVAIALVAVVCAAGGWFLFKHKPQLVHLLKQRIMSSSGAKQAPVTAPPGPPVQKPVSTPVPQAIMVPPLPTFIPKDGYDSSFAAKNPGWERYVGKLDEFRIFSASGRIIAVQVLASKDASIPESLIKWVLQEYAGSSKYRITSRITKSGVHVEYGRIQNKGEVIFYRENGIVKAFVVSINK